FSLIYCNGHSYSYPNLANTLRRAYKSILFHPISWFFFKIENMDNQSTKTIPDEVETLHKQGRKYQNHRCYKSALCWYKKVIAQIELIPQGNDDVHQLKYHVYLEMADCYREEHEYLEAQKCVSEAEKLAKQLQDEAKTAICLDRRSNIKRLEGDREGALTGFKDSLDLKLKSLGSENIDVSDSYNYIGAVYTNQGKYDEALKMYEKSVKMRSRIKGENDPGVATLHKNIGSVYYNQGKYNDALAKYNESLEIRLAQSDKNYLKIATLYNEIALVYNDQRKYDDALLKYKESLKIIQEQVGDNHPDAATLYNNIGGVYDNQGKYDDAVSMHKKSLEIWLATTGNNHPSTAKSYRDMARIYLKQSNYIQAIEFCQKSFDSLCYLYGENHPLVVKDKRMLDQYRLLESEANTSTLQDCEIDPSTLYELEDELPDDILYPTDVANISETNGVTSSGFSDSVGSGQFCNNDDNTNNRNNISSNNNEAPTSAPSTSSSNPMTPPVTGMATSIRSFGNDINNFRNGTANINGPPIGNERRLGPSSAMPIAKSEPNSYDKSFAMSSDIYIPNPNAVGLDQDSKKIEDQSNIKQYINHEKLAVEDFKKKCYDTIASEIGNKWIKLAIYLDISKDVTQHLEQQYKYSTNRSLLIKKMLHSWQEKNPSINHLAILILSLYHQKHDIIAENLYDLLRQALSNPLLSSYVRNILQDGSFKVESTDSKSENVSDSDGVVTLSNSKMLLFLYNLYNYQTLISLTCLIDVNVAIDKRKYLEAYNEALKDGKCRNDFTKIIFAGPENVGKSTIMNVFTNQGKIIRVNQTKIMDNTGKYINLIVYNILDQKIYNFRSVLYGKVIAVIKEIKRKPDIQSSDSPKSKRIKLDRPLETVERNSSLNTHQIESKINNNGFADTVISTKSTTETFHKILIYQDFMQFISNLKRKTEYHDSQYGKIVDFGGQAIYHVTHRPFLSGNSIYILVFNITHKFDDFVIDREGKKTNMTYQHAMQEWLTSTIDSHDGDETIEVEINGKTEEYSLPVVILVASHGDLIRDCQQRKDKFQAFENCIIQTLPTYKSNLCCSGIIFHCNPNDESSAATAQRKQTTLQLHYLIKQFIFSLPSMKKFIPIRWYIMASILHASIDDKSRQAALASDFNKIIDRIRNIMTFEEIKQLAIDCGLYEDDEKLRSMLLYLHDIGDILFCRKKNLEGMIVTNLDWLLSIFRSILELDKHDYKNAKVKECYREARESGKLSEVCIKNVAKKFNLDKNEKDFVLLLMDRYNIICKIEDINDNCDNRRCYQQYFVPYLLDPSVNTVDLTGYRTSDWLYIGYDREVLPYIADEIFYCHISACLKIWNNPEVKVYYRGAKFCIREWPYEIIVQKDGSYIGVLYCYQSHPEKIAVQIEKNIGCLINQIQPHIIIKDKLNEIVHERMPKFKLAQSQFYVKCGNCNQKTEAVDFLGNSLDTIRCCQCLKYFESKSARDWILNGNTRSTYKYGSKVN
ncbi:Kinesin light chain, partial [Trichoplax sp. H2]